MIFTTKKQVIDAAWSFMLEDLMEKDKLVTVSCDDDVRNYLKVKLFDVGHEVFGMLLIDNAGRLISDEIISQGTLNGSAVWPREVVKTVLKTHAAQVVVYHNHPGGKANPSMSDFTTTSGLIDALKAVGVEVYDHLIIADNDCYSMRDKGIITDDAEDFEVM